MLVSAAALGVLGAVFAGPADADTVTVSSFDKETQAGFAALNGKDAKYNTPGLAGFPNGNPSVYSGTAFALTTTNQIDGQDSILLVLSALNPLAANQTITLTFNDVLSHKNDVVQFKAADFFTTANAGFKAKDFDNGKVNGITFADANVMHAGVDIVYSGNVPKKTLVGSVTVNSPIDLRLDIFGDKSRVIASHSSSNLGIRAPEPSGFVLMAGGLLALLGARRRRSRQGGADGLV